MTARSADKAARVVKEDYPAKESREIKELYMEEKALEEEAAVGFAAGSP